MLSGCSAFGPSSSGIAFETAMVEYASGDEVTARLTNDTGDDIGYNLCFTTIEEQEEGTWEAVDTTTWESRACPDILYGLEAGGVAETTVALPAGFPAGDYRLATEVELEGGQWIKVTAPFEVQ